MAASYGKQMKNTSTQTLHSSLKGFEVVLYITTDTEGLKLLNNNHFWPLGRLF